MYCKNCGTKLTIGTKFCHQCGFQTNDPISLTDIKKEDSKQSFKPIENNRNSNGCALTILVVLGLIFIVAIFSPSDKDSRDDNVTKEIVYNSSFDGSVSQVKRYLKSNLKDPDSYDGIEWSKIQITESDPNYRYYVRHKYRAKNSFGGYVISNKIFYLDRNGSVVDVKDLE